MEERKKQKEVIINGIINPIDTNIKAIQSFLLNEKPIEYALIHIKAVDKIMLGVFKNEDL
jgi:hypothetical protein